ncbi:WW domain-containing oxidoreductase isoform X2 [Bombyx mandarina]|uniref:WW domain-containing oxidoreductase n=1 Tax=Bombyx mandarina TaxID=7092 RepID=A0A6J2JL57_BOMMA|nr:WW domain-containing oxidoreductase isoform X1 [Bombyx mandarina]XP_028030260.1 WW domain-containing oxidoreductase isoform X2 [Bombyx mandarina]
MQNVLDSDSEDELPPGWEEKSTEDGNVYFVNSYTKKTQWTHPHTGCKKVIPKDLPFGWSKTVDETSKTIYVNRETGNKTYVDPRLAFAKEEKKHVHDFRQRFDGSSTAYQVLHGVDLSGKYALITGSNTGIGYETAKSLARHGCNILFANRNMEATDKAIKEIVKETNASEENLKSIYLDLASLESVKQCAQAVETVFSDHLDMLILNAGVFGLPYTETQDKLETTFQVNHLSHMYFALLLERLLKRGSRVVFVSSESHRFANLTNIFTNQNLAMTKDQYSAMMAYNNSKLYNVITAKMLSEKWKAKGICVNSLHPGNMVSTNLSKSWWLYRLAFFLVRPFTKSLQQAAATTVYAATASELEGVTGLYFNNCFYCEESALARDKEIAQAVYDMSLRLIEDISKT